MTRFPLRGRDVELRALRELRGGAVLVRGAAGMGKSALLAALRAEPGVRVLGGRGVRAETDLPLGAVRRLFGADATGGPALHRLLTELPGPVLCWVDDAQWMDPASVAALAYVAPRLTGHPVSMVLAARPELPPDPFDSLTLGPLTDEACVAMLRDRDVPAELCAQLVELAGGNPADLVELVAGLTQEQLAGRAPLTELLPTRVADYAARLAELPEQARILAVALAAESGVDSAELIRPIADGPAAALAGGLSKAARSTLYAAATPTERRRAHLFLAESLDGTNRIWHRAMASEGPSESLADELAAAAGGEHATVARQLERAAFLTVRPRLRASRLLAAARAAWQAGRPGLARLLLSRAAGDPGETALLHGEIELRDGDPAVATHELATAAALLTEPTAAAHALLLAGEARRLSGDVRGYQAMPATTDPLAAAHFAGLRATFAGRHEDAATALREAVELGMAATDVASAVWAAEAAFALGHGERAHECAAAAVSRARLTGNAVALPWALVYLSLSAIVLDRHPCARAASREGLTGRHNIRMEHLALLGLSAALLGDRQTALSTLDEAAPGIAERGLGRPAAVAAWAHACLDLAQDRPEDALGRLENLAAGVSGDQPSIRVLATPQLVEAAVRSGHPDRAGRGMAAFDSWVRAGGSDGWRALAHRCHGLLAANPTAAEDHFRAAIALHRRTGAAMELARTQLAYAHLLRRNHRSRAARDLFREALRGCRSVGADHWADRARAGLRATGEAVAPQHPTLAGLTPQQTEISRLVAVGETNKEIARRLVISHRTVDHHLRNIFTTLGVRSRVELARRVVASEKAPAEH